MYFYGDVMFKGKYTWDVKYFYQEVGDFIFVLLILRGYYMVVVDCIRDDF